MKDKTYEMLRIESLSNDLEKALKENEALTADFEALKSELSKSDRKARRYERTRAVITKDLANARRHRDRLLDERDNLQTRLETYVRESCAERDKLRDNAAIAAEQESVHPHDLMTGDEEGS